MSDQKLINITLIDRPENAMRISFNEEDIETLKGSIADHGIMVPLLVRPRGDRYEVIDGDSRLEAAHRLRIGEIPCVVRTATDSETLVLRMLANLDRSNPDVVSEAVCISRAIASGSITAEELGAKLKRGPQWIEDRLTIAEMPDYMQDALRQKALPLGVALWLVQIDHERTRQDWTAAAIRDGMTVSGAENAYREHLKYKYIREQEGESAVDEVPPPPPAIPPVQCAACNEWDDQSTMRFVRVHKSQCVPD